MHATATENQTPLFLTEQQVAEFLCQSVRTIQKWRFIGSGPCFYKFGQSVRYRSDEVIAWAHARRKAHTSQ
ncbi:helix-turn-helix transcriptional regulator [Nioella sediminis]|jgi:predicted DNA-binding transcriptional regulator AlpA|uniref:helix-turn-helix transcriptional regulator n=1 Tax=Nioella sediminis TaxID=1912092 RepID=UPI0008FCF199|nr:helix-turn-helix domain-containing protein [Nioella sediminis]